MTEGKPYVSPPPDAEGPYKYYLIGSVTPVRVTCDTSGAKIFTEAPDPAGGGNLRVAALLVPIMKDEDVEPITKEEFVELCRRAAAQRQRVTPGDDSAKPEGERELSMDDVLKLIPANLYDGITGDEVVVYESRRDREKGLVSKYRLAGTEADARGDTETADKLDRVAIGLRRYFISRAGTILTPPDADGPYKYHLLGKVTPVRVIYNDAGRDIGAEAPDPVDGRLKINNVLLSRILSSPEVEEITKAEFVEFCQRAAARARHAD